MMFSHIMSNNFFWSCDNLQLRPIKMRTQVDPVPTPAQKLEDGRENKNFNFSNVQEIDSLM